TLGWGGWSRLQKISGAEAPGAGPADQGLQTPVIGHHHEVARVRQLANHGTEVFIRRFTGGENDCDRPYLDFVPQPFTAVKDDCNWVVSLGPFLLKKDQ